MHVVGHELRFGKNRREKHCILFMAGAFFENIEY
jgi:hypothetical protein